jgi:hypothetical protein
MEPLRSNVRQLDGSSLTSVVVDVNTITVNVPTDGIFGRINMLNIKTSDNLMDVLDKIVTHIEDLTPVNPLYDISLEMNLYQARSSMDGSLKYVIDSIVPGTNLTDPIYYDNGGILTTIVKYANNSIVNYDRTLVDTSKLANAINPDPPLNNIGITDYIEIISDEPTPRLYNIKLIVGGSFSSTNLLTPGPSVFSFKLRHKNNANVVRDTNEVSFSVDNPLFPGVVGNIISAPVFKNISGIPVCNSFTVQFQAINCVRAYYNKDYVARLSASYINPIELTISFIPVVVPPAGFHPVYGLPSSGGATNTNFTFTEIINVLPNKFISGNDVNFTALVQNSKGVSTQGNLLVIGGKSIIINTLSEDETNRFTSGSGLYPSVGTFGDPFDSNLNLATTFELILYGQYYQYIDQNFSNFLLPGPNYLNLPADVDNMRWVTFGTTILQNFLRVVFEIDGEDINGIDNVFLEDMYLFICVENKTPWFDANKSGLNPINQGDGCLDVINSTIYEKRCIMSLSNTFIDGGRVFVRVGIKKNTSSKIRKITFV